MTFPGRGIGADLRDKCFERVVLHGESLGDAVDTRRDREGRAPVVAGDQSAGRTDDVWNGARPKQNVPDVSDVSLVAISIPVEIALRLLVRRRGRAGSENDVAKSQEIENVDQRVGVHVAKRVAHDRNAHERIGLRRGATGIGGRDGGVTLRRARREVRRSQRCCLGACDGGGIGRGSPEVALADEGPLQVLLPPGGLTLRGGATRRAVIREHADQ